MLLIHSQTSTVQPLKNGQLILSHTLLYMALLIHPYFVDDRFSVY